MMPKFYDNTRVSCHLRCNQLHYYRHERHWVPVKPAAAPGFGACWHDSMDVVWEGIARKSWDDSTIIEVAYEVFLKSWTEKFGFPTYEELTEDQQREFRFRHPYTALEMLTNYVPKRRPFIESIELLEIEKPFAVPLDPMEADIFYVGRLDKVVKWNGQIWAIEHKTSSEYRKEGYFKSSFLESFSPNRQIDGYLHGLNMLYSNVKGILVDAALVHASVHEGFTFIPIEKGLEMLDKWLWQTTEEIKRIEENRKQRKLSRDNPELGFMRAFPQNDTACSHYGGCPYLDLCKFINNPETREDPPSGFKYEEWEPFEELKLADIGLRK